VRATRHREDRDGMMLSDERFGDDDCAVLAISIAVSVRKQTPPSDASVLTHMSRCSSLPSDLSHLDLSQQCSGQRRTPFVPRQRPLRRRRISGGCTKGPRKESSMLDLTSLDFALAEPATEQAEKQEPWSLNLNDHDVSAKGVAKLTRALTSGGLSCAAPLVCVHLAHNHIGDDGLATLVSAAMLGALERVERLVLTGNRISKLDGLAGACAVGRLPALRCVSLASNRLTSRAVGHLAAATLPSGHGALTQLTQLRLENNALGGADEDAIGVGAISAACPSLTILELGSNNLRDIHLDALLAAVRGGVAFRRRESVARLDISLNSFTRAKFDELDSACTTHGGVRVVC